MTIEEFIGSIDNKTYNKIRSSQSDAECRRYLKEHLRKQLNIPAVISSVCNHPCCKEEGIFELPLGSEWYCKNHYKQTDL